MKVIDFCMLMMYPNSFGTLIPVKFYSFAIEYK